VVLERARHLILDAVGLSFAAKAYEFPTVMSAALGKLSRGNCPVIGMKDPLDPRDAAGLNGTLVHGLDFDDTTISSGK
jgi:2-methylcitrate dehydratase PrpD